MKSFFLMGVWVLFVLFASLFYLYVSNRSLHASAEERNREERERGFCGNPYDPRDWPRDDEPGCHAS